VLVNLADCLRVAAILIEPFLPRTAETFYRAFNLEETTPWERIGYADAARSLNQAGLHVTAELSAGKPAPLFPKVDVRAEG
jgi:methionyl-tRNA synthetase